MRVAICVGGRMKTKAVVAVVFAALLLTACAGSPVRQDGATTSSAQPAPEKPTNKQCVAGCTGDYPTCVARGDGSREDNAECEAEFRACAAAC